MLLIISPLYASILALFYFGLSMWVVRGRWKFQVGLGTGESKELEKRVRVHGNFSEYIPLCLILLVITENADFPTWSIHTFGSLLILSRVSHLIGLGKSRGYTRCSRC